MRKNEYHYSVNSEIRRNICSNIAHFLSKTYYFESHFIRILNLNFCAKRFFWEKFDYNVSSYFRVKTGLMVILVVVGVSAVVDAVNESIYKYLNKCELD